jgi:hypothetical protein
MSDDKPKVIDFAAARDKRQEPPVVENLTRIKHDEFFFGTGEATDRDPPMVMMAAYGGAFLFEEEDARKVGQELLAHADVLRGPAPAPELRVEPRSAHTEVREEIVKTLGNVGLPAERPKLTPYEIRAFLRANLPPGTAVLFAHPMEDDPETMDMLTVLGGGLSEERLLAGDYRAQGVDDRAAGVIFNARSLVQQFYASTAEASGNALWTPPPGDEPS